MLKWLARHLIPILLPLIIEELKRYLDEYLKHIPSETALELYQILSKGNLP